MSTDAGYLFLVTKALVKMWWYNKRVNGAIFATQSSFGELHKMLASTRIPVKR
jgi:hypothetical protein